MVLQFFFEIFKYFIGTLFGPRALFRQKLHMMSSTSSVEFGVMKNVFLLFPPRKESKVFLEVGIFSASLEAIDVKKLLN